MTWPGPCVLPFVLPPFLLELRQSVAIIAASASGLGEIPSG